MYCKNNPVFFKDPFGYTLRQFYMAGIEGAPGYYAPLDPLRSINEDLDDTRIRIIKEGTGIDLRGPDLKITVEIPIYDDCGKIVGYFKAIIK